LRNEGVIVLGAGEHPFSMDFVEFLREIDDDEIPPESSLYNRIDPHDDRYWIRYLVRHRGPVQVTAKHEKRVRDEIGSKASLEFLGDIAESRQGISKAHINALLTNGKVPRHQDNFLGQGYRLSLILHIGGVYEGAHFFVEHPGFGKPIDPELGSVVVINPNNIHGSTVLYTGIRKKFLISTVDA